MSDRRIKSLLLHILEDLIDIQAFMVGASRGDLETNNMLKKAVSMSLVNIGEAVKALPESFTKRHSDIPWKKIVGMRNHTAHGYHSLENDIIWAIATKDIPALIPIMKRELEDLKTKNELE